MLWKEREKKSNTDRVGRVGKNRIFLATHNTGGVCEAREKGRRKSLDRYEKANRDPNADRKRMRVKKPKGKLPRWWWQGDRQVLAASETAGKERARPPACSKNPLCATRKPSPFPFGAGTRPEEKKKGKLLDYMGESPGRTSL